MSPLVVRLAITQQASLRVLHSPVRSALITKGIKPMSMTAWIWAGVPAVTFESALIVKKRGKGEGVLEEEERIKS